MRPLDARLEPAAERAPAPPRRLGVAVVRKRGGFRVGSPRDAATGRRRRAKHRVVVSELVAHARTAESRRDHSPRPRAAGGDGGARHGAAVVCRRAEGHGGARRHRGHRGHREVRRVVAVISKHTHCGRYLSYFRKSMCDGHPVFGRHTQIWSHLDHRHGGVGVCASPGVRAAPRARVGQRESACASERGCGGGVPGASTSADSAQISSLRAALTTGVFRRPRIAAHRDRFRLTRPISALVPRIASSGVRRGRRARARLPRWRPRRESGVFLRAGRAQTPSAFASV